MPAPLADGEVILEIERVLVSKPYIDIALALMKVVGIEVENRNYKSFRILQGQRYQSPGQFLVEGDASSASYFLAAAAIRGGEVTVTGIGKNSLQGDTAFAGVLADMGVEVTIATDHITVALSDTPVTILDPGCTSKTFPTDFEEFAQISGK